MMDATVVIDTDHLDGKYNGKRLHWGNGMGAGEALIGHGTRDSFQLIDDDGELYYSGVIYRRAEDEQVYDALFDWGMNDSGTTLLMVNGKAVIG